MIKEKIVLVNEKILWAAGGAILVLLVSLMIGGIYTITPPNGPVDSAYKINRFTGQVWLIKTYSKPVENLRVLAAREAQGRSHERFERRRGAIRPGGATRASEFTGTETKEASFYQEDQNRRIIDPSLTRGSMTR